MVCSCRGGMASAIIATDVEMPRSPATNFWWSQKYIAKPLTNTTWKTNNCLPITGLPEGSLQPNSMLSIIWSLTSSLQLNATSPTIMPPANSQRFKVKLATAGLSTSSQQVTAMSSTIRKLANSQWFKVKPPTTTMPASSWQCQVTSTTARLLAITQRGVWSRHCSKQDLTREPNTSRVITSTSQQYLAVSSA